MSRPAGRRAPRLIEAVRLLRRAWLAGLVAVAIAVNVWQFSAIEEAARHNYRAWYRYDAHDLFDIAIARDTSARERVAPFVYFGRLFPDAVVVIPSDGLDVWFEAVPSLRGIAGVSALERAAYDPVDLVDLDAIAEQRVPTASFAPNVARTVPIVDERVGYYAASSEARRFVVVTPEGPPQRRRFFAFVDVALLDDTVRASLGAP